MQIGCQSVANRNMLLLSLKDKQTETPDNSLWTIHIYIKRPRIKSVIWLS